MRLRATAIATIGALCVALSGCGEKPQTASARKSDAKASDGPGTAFTATGWKPGDATSWEQHLRTRSQAQNEYSRTAQK